MNTQWYCACPHCEATFELSPVQVSRHAGMVRCGQCREVFDAIANLLVRNEHGLAAPAPGAGLDPGGAHGADQVRDGEIPHVRDSARDIEGAAGRDRTEPTLSAIDLPVDDDLDAPGGRQLSLFNEWPVTDDEDDEHEPRAGDPARPHGEADAPVDPPREETPPEPASARKPAATLGLGRGEAGRFIRDRPHPLAGLVWFAAVLGFVYLLGLQIEHGFVERYAQHDRYRGALSLFCRVANCELPPRRNLDRFALTHTRINLHPTQPGALRVTVKLVNHAEFAQPYPSLQLTLTDRVGRVVGRRTFGPGMYLPPDSEDYVARGELVSILFDLARPHEKAVGFEIDVVQAPAS